MIVGDKNLTFRRSPSILESETIKAGTLSPFPKGPFRLDVYVTIGQLVIYVPAETGFEGRSDTALPALQSRGLARQM
jgi:hypothetical protein